VIIEIKINLRWYPRSRVSSHVTAKDGAQIPSHVELRELTVGLRLRLRQSSRLGADHNSPLPGKIVASRSVLTSSARDDVREEKENVSR